MIKQFTIITISLLTFVSYNLFAQNKNAVYYQIANMGKQLYQVTETDNALNYQRINFKPNEAVYLLAFDHKNNNLLVLSNKCNLLTISMTGEVIAKNKIEGIKNPSSLLVSTTDDKGNLYVGDASLSQFYKINTSTYKATQLTINRNNENLVNYRINRNNTIYDISYIKKKKAFYAININGELIAFDEKTLTQKVLVKLDIPNGYFGSVWFDNKNQLFAHHNKTSKIYSVDLKTYEVKLRDVAPFFGNWNDGTACFKHKFKSTNQNSEGAKNAINSNPIQTAAEIRIEQNISDISLSPNPNNGIFKVNFNSNYSKTATLRIIDINGKVIYKDSFVNNNVIDLTNEYISGTFILQIIDRNIILDAKKFVMK